MGPGNPGPAPPLPFSAPVTDGAVASVLIGGKPALVTGASGLNLPPHVGLHATDPFMAPPTQRGTIVKGSATVMIGGRPAARSGDQCTVCLALPGTLIGTAATVLIGG
jgi:uncharacterized Zn-binding protein involved in type VI secretion